MSILNFHVDQGGLLARLVINCYIWSILKKKPNKAGTPTSKFLQTVNCQNKVSESAKLWYCLFDLHKFIGEGNDE